MNGQSSIAGTVDHRRSAALAARNMTIEPGARRIGSFGFAREVLRSPKVKQAGAGAEHVDVGDPEHVPVFYLDGEVHRQRRAAIVPFFAPKAITTRYRAVMERTTDALIARLRANGEARLDEISFELAVSVASDIVGLDTGDLPAMSRRLGKLLTSSFTNARGAAGLFNRLRRTWYGYRFYVKDVRPAVRAHRAAPREDIISQTIERGYSDKAIMIECLTYATAGMVTTREFIVMVAWHLFDRADLRERFLAGDEDGQFAILLEILRLEPIAGFLYRRAETMFSSKSDGDVPADARFAIDLRAVNTDEAVVGSCPFAIDPDRSGRQSQNGTFMSFGDGAHHCPGWQVALHETRVFVDRLLRVPGIRLERAPDMSWNVPLMSYELRDALVACDIAA